MTANLEINNLTKYKFDTALLKKTAEKVIEIAAQEKPELKKFKKIEISLTFVGENRMRKLNKFWRGKNKVTDVLSFGFDEIDFKNGVKKRPIFILPDNVKRLGEVIINPDKAKNQAKKFGHSFEKEIIHLLTHGILHLFSYDHERPEDAFKMEELEEKALKKIL